MFKLVPFFCRKCKKRLCDTTENAEVWCRKCRCWNSQEKKIRQNIERRNEFSFIMMIMFVWKVPLKKCTHSKNFNLFSFLKFNVHQ